jgi:hypothetical protein
MPFCVKAPAGEVTMVSTLACRHARAILLFLLCCGFPFDEFSVMVHENGGNL